MAVGAWTKPGVDFGADEIRSWHLDRGFSDIGYHYVIRRDGTQEDGRPIEQPGAHVQGHNAHSIGICLVGGRADDSPETEGLDEFTKQELLWEFNYTHLQMTTLLALVDHLQGRFPEAAVIGHRDFPGVTKRCPGFEVATYFGET